MAASQSRALLVLNDPLEGHLIFQLNVDHLFSGQPDEVFPPILSLPEPAATFNKEVWYFNKERKMLHGENMGIAVSGSGGGNGNLIVAATSRSRTLLYDTDSRSTSTSTGPDMLSRRKGIVLVPVTETDGMFLALSLLPHLDPEGTPQAELLAKDGGGRLAWHPVPDPPFPSSRRSGPGPGHISGYFVAGTRIWVSFMHQGTFSFDTVSRLWRMEGTWKLPVKGRALLIPDFFGRQLLFGFSSVDHHFCACDIGVEAGSPPVIIKSWPEAIPSQLVRRARYFFADASSAKLAYYGAGRFCISTVIGTGYFPQKLTNMDQACNLPRYAVSLVAMEVTPGMHLIKHKLDCYSMPPEATVEGCHLF